MLARLAIVALGAVVCAWFALSAHQAHEIDQATAILSQPGSTPTAQLDKVSSLLASAQVLDPDRALDILRARVQISRLHLVTARRILDGVVRSEPLNLDGWIWLGGASFGNPAQATRITAHLTELDPIDARRHSNG